MPCLHKIQHLDFLNKCVKLFFFFRSSIVALFNLTEEEIWGLYNIYQSFLLKCYFEFLVIPGMHSPAWKTMTLLMACFRSNTITNE